MSMTRKDYVAIAEAMTAARADVSTQKISPKLALEFAEDRIARALADDNPRFDRDRFIAACRKGEVQS
jgi:hypothetical protein